MRYLWREDRPPVVSTTVANPRLRAAPVREVRAIGLPSDRNDIAAGLAIACEMKGLGPAGGSGLLAVLFPDAFGTADQFVVKALRGVPDLPESSALARMRPAQLTLTDAAILIAIMRRQAAKNLGAFRPAIWTPRMIDKILWTLDR